MPEHECYLLVAFENGIANYEEGPESLAVTRAADPAGLDTLVELVTHAGLDGIDFSLEHPAELPGRMSDRGLKAVVWTVNEVEAARKLVACGIASITTDLPVQMRAGLRF